MICNNLKELACICGCEYHKINWLIRKKYIEIPPKIGTWNKGHYDIKNSIITEIKRLNKFSRQQLTDIHNVKTKGHIVRNGGRYKKSNNNGKRGGAMVKQERTGQDFIESLERRMRANSNG